MIHKISTTIHDHQLACHSETILVALSGGPDSVALLHILSFLRKSERWKLTALYINHGIRPKEAEKEEEFCRGFCEKLSVCYLVEHVDIPKLARSQKKGLEETARDVRYEILEQTADQIGAERIAIGHHQDDQVETVLFRIIRGTGLTGLIGIPYKRGRIIRPLLSTRKEEILAYIKKNELSYCEDSSNKDLSFRRNYLRHHLLPMIRSDLNPQVDLALAHLAEIVAGEECFLQEVVRKEAQAVVSVRCSGKVELLIEKFLKKQQWLRWRLLRYCMAVVSGRVGMQSHDRDLIERLDRFCFSKQKSMSLPGQLHVTRIGDRFFFHQSKREPYSFQLSFGHDVLIEGIGLRIKAQLLRKKPLSVTMPRQAKRVLIDYDRLVLPLEVRTICAGDRFIPLGMKGHKKVGDYLTDRKVPPILRDEIPVVADQRGIIWLVGYEIDDRVKIVEQTRKVCRIGCSERKKSRK